MTDTSIPDSSTYDPTYDDLDFDHNLTMISEWLDIISCNFDLSTKIVQHSLINIYNTINSIYKNKIDITDYIWLNRAIYVFCLYISNEQEIENKYIDILTDCLIMCGDLGSKSLIDILIQASGNINSIRESIILERLISIPSVQIYVITPALVLECKHDDPNRRKLAITTLGRLYDRMSLAIPTLLEILPTGILPRSLIVWAIRCAGPIGEAVLLTMLTQDPHYYNRAACAYALGVPMISNPPYLDIKVQVWDNRSSDIVYITEKKRTLQSPRFQTRKLAKRSAYDDKSTCKDDIDDFVDNQSDKKSNLVTSICIDPALLLDGIRRMAEAKTPFIFPDSTYNAPPTPTVLQGLHESLADPSPLVRESTVEAIGRIFSLYSHDLTLINRIYNSSPSDLLLHIQPTYIKPNVSSGANLSSCQSDFLFHVGLKKPTVSKKNLDVLTMYEREQLEPYDDLIWQLLGIFNDTDRRPILALLSIMPHMSPYLELLDANDLIIEAFSQLIDCDIWPLRRAAISGILHFPNAEKVVPNLIKLFKEGKSTRTEAATALMHLGIEGADALVAILNEDHESRPELRASVAACLADSPLYSPCLSTFYTALLKNKDKSSLVRTTVLSSIYSLWSRANETVPLLSTRSVVPMLINTLKDPQEMVQTRAAHLLASMGPLGLSALRTTLLESKNWKVRLATVEGFKHVGTCAIFELLIALDDITIQVRKAACNTVLALNNISEYVKSLEATDRQKIQNLSAQILNKHFSSARENAVSMDYIRPFLLCSKNSMNSMVNMPTVISNFNFPEKLQEYLLQILQ